jgi:hypothetical protein
MDSQAESDDKRQPVSDTNEPNETHHADDAHVEDGTEQPLVVQVASGANLGNSPHPDGNEQSLVHVASGKGSQSFPLLRLPPELRTMILKMALFSPMGITIPAFSVRDVLNVPFGQEDKGYVFFAPADPHKTMYKHVYTNTSWVIGVMAMCRQIRSEIKNLLSSYDINVHAVDFDKIGARQHGISRTVPLLIRSVSSFLGKTSGRVVLWENWDGHHLPDYEKQRRKGFSPAPRVPGLDNSLATYAQAVQPLQLFIGLSMTFHEVSGARDLCLCKQDAPVTGFDCRRIECIVPLGDRVNARKMVDEVVDRRLELLRCHFPHRWCYVRARRSKLEGGLALARQYMREEVDRIC